MSEDSRQSAGSIRYLQIPAADVERSADFYNAVFGWHIRRNRHGDLSFDDTGDVSGTWITGRPPSSEPGLLPFIRVERVERALEAVVEAGGEVVTPLTGQGEGEAYATFRDPAGNGSWGSSTSRVPLRRSSGGVAGAVGDRHCEQVE